MKYLIILMALLPAYTMGCDEEYDREIPKFEGLDEYALFLCGALSEVDSFVSLSQEIGGAMQIVDGETVYAESLYEAITCLDNRTLIEFAQITDGGFHRTGKMLSALLKGLLFSDLLSCDQKLLKDQARKGDESARLLIKQLGGPVKDDWFSE